VKCVTAQAMRQLDQAAQELGLTVPVLMEHAGLRVAEAAMNLLGAGNRGLQAPDRPAGLGGRTVAVLAGRGNNGGDGLAAARHLANAGARVRVGLLADPAGLRGAARWNWEVLEAMATRATGIRLEAGAGARVRSLLDGADLAVDALLGLGLAGEVGSPYREAIEALNASGLPVVAVDVPSGLDADTGQPAGACVRASVTVTFGWPKPGLFLYPGAVFAGRVRVADIGIPPALAENQPGEVVTGELARRLLATAALAPRRPDAHKGTHGRVLVVGGAPGYTGAPALAAWSALRTGTGLVWVAVPRPFADLMETKLTEAITRALPAGEGDALAAGAVEPAAALAEQVDAVALGPGLGTGEGQRAFVAGFLAAETVRARPLVIDADGLNALAGLPEAAETLRRRSPAAVLTPHPGEMARLLATDVASCQADRVGTAVRAARTFGAVVAFKGRPTVIAAPDGRWRLNLTGNPGLATAGSGDVLTGAIAACLAQGLDPWDAASLGVYLHGLAADLVAARRGEAGMVAGDAAEALPEAIRRAGEPDAGPGGRPDA